jgi:multidrug efflux system outer membrane protein
LNAGAERSGTAGSAANGFGLGAQLGYEIDLSGRLRGSRDAAQLDAQAQAQLYESAKLILQADIAQTYFQLRATEREHQLVRDTAASWRDALRVTERRVAAGEAAELELARLRSEAAGTDAEAAQLAQRRALLENLLALLTGQPASNLKLAATAAVAQLPTIPAGLPSTLLARRPDVAAAQTQLLAAQARLGVAQRAWFPQLALTASGGLASGDLSDLLKGAARSWSLGALFALPLFDGGARQAGVNGARAQAEGAMASHRQAVLIAFKDVEDQLANLSGLRQQQLALAEAVSASERAASLSAARERGGIVAPLERLDAQRSALRQRRAALQVEAAQAQATVALVRALGGSWST